MTSVATRSRRAEPKAPAPERPILVATAGEDESRGALRVAAALAAIDGAPVVALGVAAPFPHNLSARVTLRPPPSIDEQTRRDLQRADSRLAFRNSRIGIVGRAGVHGNAGRSRARGRRAVEGTHDRSSARGATRDWTGSSAVRPRWR